MTKEQAVQLIRELAAARDGIVSFDVFVQETGIPGQRLRKEPWYTKWNDLLIEAGLKTNRFGKPRTPDDVVAGAVAEFIKRKGLARLPTEDEYAREKKRNPSFPAIQVIRRVRESGKLRSILESFNAGDDEYADVRTLAASLPNQNQEVDESIDNSARIQGFVYMLRTG
jgi:hypothetical protein